jgi:hypothetical protein
MKDVLFPMLSRACDDGGKGLRTARRSDGGSRILEKVNTFFVFFNFK